MFKTFIEFTHHVLEGSKSIYTYKIEGFKIKIKQKMLFMGLSLIQKCVLSNKSVAFLRNLYPLLIELS